MTAPRDFPAEMIEAVVPWMMDYNLNVGPTREQAQQYARQAVITALVYSDDQGRVLFHRDEIEAFEVHRTPSGEPFMVYRIRATEAGSA